MRTFKIRKFLMGTGVLIGSFALAFTPQAFAQDEGEDDLDSVELEEIIVTGSRIRRVGVDTFYPAISVSSEELAGGSFTNVADALNQIPSFGNPDVTPFGDFSQFETGQNFVDFLGLGAQRTLTLVNGRRFVSANVPNRFGASGGLQVDFNVIPVALVDRIETIGVGGAPIYGSDAIAGTINVILKDRFEGVQLSLRRGASGKGDGDFEEVSLVAGANFSDDRGNVTLSMEHYTQDGMLRDSRPRYEVNDPYFGAKEARDPADPNSIDVRRIYRDSRINIFTAGGLIDPSAFTIPSFGIGAMQDGNFWQFDPNSNLVPFTPGVHTGGSPFFASGGDGPDWGLVDQFRSPMSRDVFTTRMNYDITDRVSFSADVLFANTVAAELVDQGGFQTWPFGGTSTALLFPADHPLLHPDAVTLLAGMGATEFYLHRFNNDVIPSGNEREQFLWHATAGLDGDFDVGDRNFFWNISATHGESDHQTRTKGIIDERFLNALDVRVLSAADLAAVDADPTAAEQAILGISGTNSAGVGDMVCEKAYQATIGTYQGASGSGVVDGDLPFVGGCVPLNLFGEGARSDAAADWVTGDQMSQTDIEQAVFNINFGGDLFELPGGWTAFNVGFEQRNEFAAFVPSLGSAVPLTRSAGLGNTGGSYETDEIYGEIAIPLVSSDMDIPLIAFAELNGAVREIDNSLAGNATVWTAGMRYSPVRDISFRANYTESVRAPSLVELFAPQGTSFSQADDPCDFRYSTEGDVPMTRQANCANDIPGYDPTTFVSNVANATALGKSGGNPNLTNESAESYAIGLTFEPRWVENLLFTADYINIELTDAIQILTLEQLMQSCYDSPSFPSSSCNSFTRDAGGQVIDFLTGQANASLFAYEQVEFGFSYEFELASLFGRMSDSWAGRDIGNFRTNIRLNHPLERTIVVVDEPAEATLGGYTDPDWSGTFDFIWTGQNSRIFWRLLWQDEALLDPKLEDIFEDLDGNLVSKTDARFISNVTYSYNLGSFFSGAPDETTLQLTVGNLFDREPDYIQEAIGHLGNTEFMGRYFTMTLQGNW